MNDQKMKFRVGFFVTASIVLLLVMLFFFGLSGIFVEKAKVYTTFSESIQGLSVGSDVTYRGTKIGSVSAISISITQQLTRVEMELDTEYFVEGELNDGEMQLSYFERIFGKELKKGLSCRLMLTGITGMRVIELDYFDPQLTTASKRGKWSEKDDFFFVPSVPSPFKDITTTLTNSLERISRVHFEEISDELENSLAHLSALLSNPSLMATLERMNAISAHWEEASRVFANAIDGNRLNNMIATLEADLKAAGQLMQNMDASVREMKLKESAASLREAAEAVRMFQGESAGVLLQFNATLETLRQLCDQINRNPTMFFGGKRVVPEKP